jgi:hypothetical protein
MANKVTLVQQIRNLEAKLEKDILFLVQAYEVGTGAIVTGVSGNSSEDGSSGIDRIIVLSSAYIDEFEEDC